MPSTAVRRREHLPSRSTPPWPSDHGRLGGVNLEGSGVACYSPEQGCVNTCAPPPACTATPARTRFAGAGAASCARHDGDATACGEAYFLDTAGPSTCFPDGEACCGCDVAAAIAGECTRDCAPPDTCDDPARTLYVGTWGCGNVGANAAACATAFTTYDGLVMSCHQGSDGSCYVACSPWLETEGFCTNACEPAPACAGQPERTEVQSCYLHGGDPSTCTGSFMRYSAEPLACVYRDDGFCFPCLEDFERAGLCLNVCAPPVCAGDPARTALLDGGPASCGAFDGDPAACEHAFYVGTCGTASCTYETGGSRCRACTPFDPGGCTNSCGDLHRSQYPERPPSLLTIEPVTAHASFLTTVAGSMRQPAVGDTGLVYAWGGRQPTCHQETALFTIDPGSGSLDPVAPLPEPAGGIMAFDPRDGRLYLLGADEQGTMWLSAVDPATGLAVYTPTNGLGPFAGPPSAMTWADACDAFVVATFYGNVLLLDPATATFTPTALYVSNEWDEGNWPVGLVLEGDVCPVLELPTITSTTTTTSTTSSTSTSTLPSEPLAGARLLMTSDAARPGKRRLEVRSSDRTLGLGEGNDSADDPVLHGGTLRVTSTAGTIDAVYALDGGWRYLGKRGRDKGYKRAGKGPIRSVVVRRGRSIEIIGKGPELAQSLLVDPGDVRVVLRLGGRQWCLAFGGTSVERTPSRLVAHAAPAPGTCAGW